MLASTGRAQHGAARSSGRAALLSVAAEAVHGWARPYGTHRSRSPGAQHHRLRHADGRRHHCSIHPAPLASLAATTSSASALVPPARLPYPRDRQPPGGARRRHRCCRRRTAAARGPGASATAAASPSTLGGLQRSGAALSWIEYFATTLPGGSREYARMTPWLQIPPQPYCHHVGSFEPPGLSTELFTGSAEAGSVYARQRATSGG